MSDYTQLPIEVQNHEKKQGFFYDSMGEVSDGYHTFNELYDFRKAYNALLFNEWAQRGVCSVHKSKLHSDGELPFGGGWFVVSADTPVGQITNHYTLEDWDLFVLEEREKAAEWDGHTPQDALSRLLSLTKAYEPHSQMIQTQAYADLDLMDSLEEVVKALVMTAYHCGNWQKDFTPEHAELFVKKIKQLQATTLNKPERM